MRSSIRAEISGCARGPEIGPAFDSPGPLGECMLAGFAEVSDSYVRCSRLSKVVFKEVRMEKDPLGRRDFLTTMVALSAAGLPVVVPALKPRGAYAFERN